MGNDVEDSKRSRGEAQGKEDTTCDQGKLGCTH